MNNLSNEFASSKPELTRGEKTRDFLIGLIGWWVINGLCACVSLLPGFISTATPNSSPDLSPLYAIINLLGCVWLVVNIAVLVILAFRRPWVALGMLAAFGIALALVVLAAILFVAGCFALLYQSSAPK